MLFGFNSANAEYYTDDIHLENLGVENAYAHTTYNSQAKISKTGYRTEFQAKYDYVDLNELDKQGNISVMDYYKMQNVQADTNMRNSFSNKDKDKPAGDRSER